MKLFEQAPLQAEILEKGIWSKEEINAIREQVRQAWGKIKASPADVVFEQAIEQAYPALDASERQKKGDELYEYISAIAQQDDAVLTKRISQDELSMFIRRYLER